MSAELAQLTQIVINGIALGSIYALVALGLVLAYKSTEVLNFAHGDLLMLSAFVAWGFISLAALPFWFAFLATVVVMATLGYVLESQVMRRIVGQPQFAGVMLTLGVAFMLRGLVSMSFGPQERKYDTPFSGRTTHLGNVVVSDLSLLIVAVALLVTLLLYFFFTRTQVGVAIQASSQNQLAAFLCGIRVKRLNSIVWAISGALAALAGVLLAPVTLVDISLWFVVLKAMAALVLGGFGSAPGAIVGGLLIGVIEQLTGVYGPDGSKDIVAYVVLIAVLAIAPHGLLGEAHGRRV
jgi:branched-chain amino acid transport system permease protein